MNNLLRKYLLTLFSHRTVALLRWDLYFIKVRCKNLIFYKYKIIDKWIKANPEVKMLNLGSGPRGSDERGWFNIDGFNDKSVHFLCDFNRSLPFKNNTFDFIFTEHVLEHFDYNNGQKLIKECFRILKPGGIIRIIVPDGEKILRSYFEAPDFIANYKECRSNIAMEAVNNWFYQRYEHQTIYDKEYLTFALREAQFKMIEKVDFKKSKFMESQFIIDDPKYEWESLYIEAMK